MDVSEVGKDATSRCSQVPVLGKMDKDYSFADCTFQVSVLKSFIKIGKTSSRQTLTSKVSLIFSINFSIDLKLAMTPLNVGL